MMTGTTIQQKAIRHQPPQAVFCHHRGCDIAGTTLGHPPSIECGDWIRVAATAHGFVIGVGDAAGHGTDASPVARLMRNQFDAAIQHGATAPEDILYRINAALRGLGGLGAAMVIACDGRGVVAGCAGIEAPALFHGGAMESLRCSGMILGFRRQIDLEIATRELPTDSFLSLWSDGVTETEDPETREPFSPGRFAEILEPGVSSGANLMACLDAVSAHGPQRDDRSLLLVQISGRTDAVTVRSRRRTASASA
jgi:serine phosphatase RsbU (regulator of sigma subunit)